MFCNMIGDVIAAFKTNEIDILAHGVNCSKGFGSGIAGQIAQQFPEVQDIFFEHDFTLGDIQPVKISEGNETSVENVFIGGKWIINCATQQYYGNDPASQPNGMYCSYDAIEKCMRSINDAFKDKVIGIPFIGAGLAGGEWKYIKAIISNVFADSTNTIVAYKYGASEYELATIEAVIKYYEPTGFHSYTEKLNDNWKGLEDFVRGLKSRYIWLTDNYIDICKIRFNANSCKGELLSVLNKIHNEYK